MNLFMVAILAWFWLGEKLTCFEVVAIFVAFGGVSLTSRRKDETLHEGEVSDNNYPLGISLTIASCMLVAVTVVSARKLKKL